MPIVTGPVGAALVADPAPLIRAVAADVHAGAPAAGISRGFHSALVDYTRAIADRARRSVGLDTVALTGGVFQNALLLSACRRGLRADGFTVLCHRHVPPNDGGLALGQLLVGSSG